MSLFVKNIGIALISLLTLGTTAAHAEIRAYLSEPDAQFAPSSYTNVVNVDFDAAPFTASREETTPIAVPSFGTYQFSNTSAAKVVAANDANNQYGNNTGQFLGFGNYWTAETQGLRIDFASSQVRYFGFAWCAGDAGNTVSFLRNNQIVAVYSTDQINAVLNGSSTLQSQSGATYQTSAYKGTPPGSNVAAGSNSGENYTYLNFIATGEFFDGVILNNVGNSGFESDNHAISTSQQAALGAFVPAGSAVVVPEPGALTLMLLPIGIVATIARRRKR